LILCRPTGVLPAVPPIPKAPGTLLPAFDSSADQHLEAADKTSSSQHSCPPTERLEFIFFWSFSVIGASLSVVVVIIISVVNVIVALCEN